jgi:hypothetical protein
MFKMEGLPCRNNFSKSTVVVNVVCNSEPNDAGIEFLTEVIDYYYLLFMN